MSHVLASKNTPDDYLRVIWDLSFPTGELGGYRRGPKATAPARIAEVLDVSRASCGEMLNRLAERGLIARGERKEAILTAAGRIEAMRLVRRHRIVERMATDLLQYPEWDAPEQAKRLVLGFDDDSAERLFRALGEPLRNPQGTPIDPDFELRENATLTSLLDVRSDADVTVVRTALTDAALAQVLAVAGLKPGCQVRITGGATAEEGPLVQINGEKAVPLPRAALRDCFVRAEGVPEIPAQAECWASTRVASTRRPLDS